MPSYKKLNYKADSLILVLCLIFISWEFSSTGQQLFSSHFQFEKSNLYGILLALAPTLLGFVITSMSIVLSYLTSDTKVAKEVRSECGNYIRTVFVYGKISLSFMSIVALSFYVFDTSLYLSWIHYILFIALFYSIFSFFNIVLMMGDVMKLIIEYNE